MVPDISGFNIVDNFIASITSSTSPLFIVNPYQPMVGFVSGKVSYIDVSNNRVNLWLIYSLNYSSAASFFNVTFRRGEPVGAACA